MLVGPLRSLHAYVFHTVSLLLAICINIHTFEFADEKEGRSLRLMVLSTRVLYSRCTLRRPTRREHSGPRAARRLRHPHVVNPMVRGELGAALDRAWQRNHS